MKGQTLTRLVLVSCLATAPALAQDQDAEAPAGGDMDDTATAEPAGTPDEASPPPPMHDAEPPPEQPADPVEDAAPPFEEAPAPEAAPVEPEAFEAPNLCTGPFCQGSIGFTLLVGSASVGNLDYLILGGGVSYYVVNGLALGLDADVWFLEDPTIYAVTPQAKYVLHFIPVIKPYVGAFYRHYFLTDGFDDLDSIGGRVGAYLVTGGGSYLGLGGIYEKFLGCDDSDFRDCDGWYPEITIGFSL